MMKNNKIETDWTQRLLQWFDKAKRSMPWRGENDPYRIWVSEVMLQQTRVEQAIPFYLRFIERFPSLEDLALSPIEDVLNAWNGLGYYRRGKQLHQAVQIIYYEHKGVFPKSFEDWLSLPGIGRYTAGALMSIALDKPCPAVDGNVARVISRFKGIRDDVTKDITKKNIEGFLQQYFPVDRCGDFTQALMELGAMMCLSKNPKCLLCPLTGLCFANLHQAQEELPVKKKKSSAIKEEWAVFLIETLNTVYLVSRKNEALLSDFWGLPMVYIEKTSAMEKAFKEKYGQSVKIVQKIGEMRYVFSHREWNMSIYQAKLNKTARLLKEDCTYDDDCKNIAKPFQKILSEFKIE